METIKFQLIKRCATCLLGRVTCTEPLFRRGERKRDDRNHATLRVFEYHRVGALCEVAAASSQNTPTLTHAMPGTRQRAMR